MTLSLDLLTGATTRTNAKLDSSPMQRVLGLLYAAAGREMDPQIYHMATQDLGSTFNKTVTMAATYETSNGKFPSAYGNVALLDCHYLLDYFFDYTRNTYAPTLPFIQRQAFLIALNRLENDLADAGTTWCTFAYEIDGVLTDQSSYYMG